MVVVLRVQNIAHGLSSDETVRGVARDIVTLVFDLFIPAVFSFRCYKTFFVIAEWLQPEDSCGHQVK